LIYYTYSAGSGQLLQSSLENRCGFSHKFAQDGCNGTCVKLEASKPT